MAPPRRPTPATTRRIQYTRRANPPDHRTTFDTAPRPRRIERTNRANTAQNSNRRLAAGASQRRRYSSVRQRRPAQKTRLDGQTNQRPTREHQTEPRPTRYTATLPECDCTNDSASKPPSSTLRSSNTSINPLTADAPPPKRHNTGATTPSDGPPKPRSTGSAPPNRLTNSAPHPASTQTTMTQTSSA